MEWLKDIKVLVLDLDGTLYQDMQFFNPYLKYLFEGADDEAQKWCLEAKSILNGNHTLKMGHFFSPQHNSGFRHTSGLVTSAYSWKSADAGKERVVEDSRQAPASEEAMYIGDAWSVVGAISAYANVPAAKRTEAFTAVRRDMLKKVDAHSGIKSAICGLTSIDHKLLMSNSSEETAKDFVALLDLEDAFDCIIYGGEKPKGLSEYLEKLMAAENIRPEEILSIGDHAWNELYPVKRIGGRTAWISPYESWDEEAWDLRLRTVDELEQLLRKLQEERSNENAL